MAKRLLSAIAILTMLAFLVWGAVSCVQGQCPECYR